VKGRTSATSFIVPTPSVNGKEERSSNHSFYIEMGYFRSTSSGSVAYQGVRYPLT
jgi:hypothetical protein